MTAPEGTFGSAEFSIPTLNPKAWRSLRASAWSLPVRSGISIKVGAPPSTGSPSNIWDRVQKVANTNPEKQKYIFELWRQVPYRNTFIFVQKKIFGSQKEWKPIQTDI